MPGLEQPRREHPSTYFVQDRSNEEELERLRVQDQMLTTDMGGVLSEQPTTLRLSSVLDVGSGSGSWVIDVARAYPEARRLEGADVSLRMVEYARGRTAEEHLEDRVSFHVMDALRMLEFPPASFDLVNLRLGMSFLRTWDWPKMIREMSRVCRSDGIIRFTEASVAATPCPALSRLLDLMVQAIYRSGSFFAPERDGLIGHLEDVLRKNRVRSLQTKLYHLTYQAGTEQGRLFIEDMSHVFRTGLQFLRKWTQFPSDYQSLYQQALKEMQQPDFVATAELLSVWGQPPVV
ncbi:class I SAM-dependent methyltransferase [Ktedonosporobacter rubrisoli]|uniref:Class I SAM-dependent methyltransferase n=1 Tax=Ktedonosporobacter rubrisoli TaxID=2509675 RepID=A0A4P6JP77_KTERU|nr:class I SAM-dependent methyltransferase [Ktedonosporobacter rubrisoli]QBD76882.1 class I SAM-dependent methyltransferase [Ktedonosporobacter rubrisoli]